MREISHQRSDILVSCSPKKYNVRLYSLQAHFFISATELIDESDKNGNDECPSALALASLGGVKKLFSVPKHNLDELAFLHLGVFLLLMI